MQQQSLPNRAIVREAILKRIKMATSGRPVPDIGRPAGSFVHKTDTSLPETFTANLQKVSGNVTICETGNETLEALKKLVEANCWKKIVCPDLQIIAFLRSAEGSIDFESNLTLDTEVVITGCEALIADTGSILVSSRHSQSRKALVYSPVHIVIAAGSQIVETAEEAMHQLLQRYPKNIPSLISIITGPSRTADIEKTLILGAHGPKALFVIITKQNL
jgi:L-lactate dehydrogenase complex protein LldG